MWLICLPQRTFITKGVLLEDVFQIYEIKQKSKITNIPKHYAMKPNMRCTGEAEESFIPILGTRWK
jgi:hypothetical protein